MRRQIAINLEELSRINLFRINLELIKISFRSVLELRSVLTFLPWTSKACGENEGLVNTLVINLSDSGPTEEPDKGPLFIKV